MRKREGSRAQMFMGIALILLATLLVCWKLLQSQLLGSPQFLFDSQSIAGIPPQVTDDARLLHGKAPTLSWIVGKECQQGVQAYLRTADTNPDAALVGTGWVDPTNGNLIQGQSNNCVPRSLSMDSVVQLIHSKGGMAYLTVTIMTDTGPGAWTAQQETDYIIQGTTHQSYIDNIVQEVKRLNYDGVIMDLEGADSNTPSIGQYFATFNQKVWAALRPLHKKYGIALIHKLNDHDDYYNINGFEDWNLLGHAADFIVIMALDQSYFTPGPTVSVPWLKQLLAYTLQTMPQMLPHIIWELPFYGATWRLNNGNWVFNSGINDKDAQNLVASIPASRIDQTTSDLNDATSVHLTYTDSSGVERTVWYPGAKNLVNIVTEFRQILKQTPQFHNGQLAIAVWYRASWEPDGVWPLLDAALTT
ncbi:MAG: hypothetical protein JO011_13075 [Ktedonobacteraceae bacterium]|nr:hypothetical protein [Ktedonobacteraceae bacterium]